MTLLDQPVTYLREAVSFSHAQEIVKPYGEIELILDWARCELEHEWRWQLVSVSGPTSPGRYIFYFDSERDHVAFVLKWS
jgi:hypothetical protein